MALTVVVSLSMAGAATLITRVMFDVGYFAGQTKCQQASSN